MSTPAGPAPQPTPDPAPERQPEPARDAPGGGSATVLAGKGWADPRVSRARPRVMLSLQRSAGNRAVAGMLQRSRVQRAASPVVVQRAESYSHKGIDVSTDVAAVRSQLEKLVERGGLEELRSWYASFTSLSRAQRESVAAGLGIADIQAIDNTVRDVDRELESDATTYRDGLRQEALNTTEGILSASEERIRAELERYGIKETELPPPPGQGGAQGAPPSYGTQISVENTGAVQDAQARAKNLMTSRREADKAHRAFTDIALVPGMEDIGKVINEGLPQVGSKYEEALELWKMTEDLYAKQALAATAEFPVLAMYASGPNAANALQEFASQPVEKVGETVWREAQTRLENIATLKGELDSHEPLANKQVLQMVLGKPDLKPWQKKVGKDFAEAVQDNAERTKQLWQMIAIGVGLIAALPTGGSAAALAITTVAAISGAAVATYNAYEAWQQYRVDKAGAKTDLDKARNISKEEPSFFWVAVEIVGAGLEIGAAAVAFKSLVSAIKEAKHTRDVLKMAEAIEKSAPAASKGPIAARAAGEVGPEAVTEMIVAEGRKFRSGDLAKIKSSLEQSAMEGWAEAYDAMAANNKIRPLTEEALHAELARIPAKDPHRFRNMAEQYIYDYDVMRNQGIYSPETGIIFVKPGGQHTVANVVAHEMVHAGQARMGQQLNGFWAEFEAMSAQKRLIRAMDRAGVGGQIGPEVSWLRDITDSGLATYINRNYGYPIPAGVTGGFGGGDAQITRAAMEAAQRVLAVGGL